MLTRLTQEQTIAAFGDPKPHITPDGTVDPNWEKQIISYARLPDPLPLSWDESKLVRLFKCHRRLVQRFEAAFARAYLNPYSWDTIDSFGGCYAFRTNRKNPKRLSMHAWGAAVDIDVADNEQGEKPDMDPAVIAAFESEGFLWGGNFQGDARDGMHMEASVELVASL